LLALVRQQEFLNVLSGTVTGKRRQVKHGHVAALLGLIFV